MKDELRRVAGAPVQGVEVRATGAYAPCLRCGASLPVRRMGCRGGHCPNCRHPYPHGDCSD